MTHYITTPNASFTLTTDAAGFIITADAKGGVPNVEAWRAHTVGQLFKTWFARMRSRTRFIQQVIK